MEKKKITLTEVCIVFAKLQNMMQKPTSFAMIDENSGLNSLTQSKNDIKASV